MSHLTVEQAQQRLGIRRPTLYSWVRQGKLHPVRAGRGLLFEEDEVMKLLGRGPRVPIWIVGGGLEEAKNRVRSLSHTGVRPHFLIEYLESPTSDFVRARILAAGDGTEIQVPAPGGIAFDRFQEAMKQGDYVFQGHEESIWKVNDVKPETSPTGLPYIALELLRLRTGAGSEREARLKEILARMEKGVITGSLTPYKREDLYERRAR